MKTNQKGFVNVILIILVVFLAGVVGYFVLVKKTSPSVPQTSTSTPITQSSTSSVEYKNTEYGFSFFLLPENWKGYSIITSKWEGYTAGPRGDTTIEEGPIISIRNPKWTSQNPRQDIPIMILTLNQWSSLQQEKFHIGAAPIGPSELGRNAKYVFALPARYNFAFLTGFEEVQKILEGNPLRAF